MSEPTSNIQFAEFRTYELDFTKVTSLDDVIAILRGMQIAITIQDGYESKWEQLMPYLKAKPEDTPTVTEGEG